MFTGRSAEPANEFVADFIGLGSGASALRVESLGGSEVVVDERSAAGSPRRAAGPDAPTWVLANSRRSRWPPGRTCGWINADDRAEPAVVDADRVGGAPLLVVAVHGG